MRGGVILNMKQGERCSLLCYFLNEINVFWKILSIKINIHPIWLRESQLEHSSATETLVLSSFRYTNSSK